MSGHAQRGRPSTETVVHSLEPLNADRMMICRWTLNRSGDLVLTRQRAVTDPATITTARDALNSLRHSWWFNLHWWFDVDNLHEWATPSSGGRNSPDRVDTELVFGADRSAVAVHLPQPGDRWDFSTNGILIPGDDNAAVDTLTDRTVPHLLARVRAR